MVNQARKLGEMQKKAVSQSGRQARLYYFFTLSFLFFMLVSWLWNNGDHCRGLCVCRFNRSTEIGSFERQIERKVELITRVFTLLSLGLVRLSNYHQVSIYTK